MKIDVIDNIYDLNIPTDRQRCQQQIKYNIQKINGSTGGDSSELRRLESKRPLKVLEQ